MERCMTVVQTKPGKTGPKIASMAWESAAFSAMASKLCRFCFTARRHPCFYRPDHTLLDDEMRLPIAVMLGAHTVQYIPPTTNPSLNASLQVASIIEASSIPCVEKLVTIAVAAIDLLQKMGKNKKDYAWGSVELYISRTFSSDGYLAGVAQDLEDMQQKHCRIKSVLHVNNSIQGYRKHIDDLKIDFLGTTSKVSHYISSLPPEISPSKNMPSGSAANDSQASVAWIRGRREMFCVKKVCNKSLTLYPIELGRQYKAHGVLSIFPMRAVTL
ncbi:uncharacterized protein BT62DRAFT_999381 [Guyanagaster necrorhizus]|uniref:Uncharacterized protein n=1 Tax=Guyanagaster necrorhizus TaxID=856835 RepID=A0A9P7W3F0_9AGAR|nr:uncharacterized protein BT62DRAFT_999381 [Guyanagaster necrorhizus MCA 3950]KAG7451705.1 hypothetical protein BT62DRAFT_999381 [Guyanagaster necrorhizus MCA 3950]